MTIRFDEAILMAAAGLMVNVATAWLLSAGASMPHGGADNSGTQEVFAMKRANTGLTSSNVCLAALELAQSSRF